MQTSERFYLIRIDAMVPAQSRKKGGSWEKNEEKRNSIISVEQKRECTITGSNYRDSG